MTNLADKNNANKKETIFFYDKFKYPNNHDNDSSDEEYEAFEEAKDNSYSYNDSNDGIEEEIEEIKVMRSDPMNKLEACANDALQSRMKYIDAYYASNNYSKHWHRQMKKRQRAQIDRPVPSTSPKDIVKKSLHGFTKFSARTKSPQLLATLSLLPPSCRISNTSPRTEHFQERKIDDLYPDVYYDTSL